MAVTSLRVEMFGGFRVIAGDRGHARLPTARQQELLAFLLLHTQSGPMPRQRVAGSLWPDSSDVQALTNLRRELHHLRDGSPALAGVIDSGSRTLGWRSAARVSVDVLEFEHAADRGLTDDRDALRDAARLYKGDLLPDISGEWIAPDRDRLRERAKQVLRGLVAGLEQDCAFGDAIEHAQQWLRLDPIEEQAWCSLMRSQARRGDRAAALHTYQQCAAVLKSELGIQPSAATRLTYREILDVDPEARLVQPPPRTAVYPLVGRHSEWQALLAAWRSAAAGQPRLFLISGEPGIGKTRLAEELIDWARLNGVASVAARCYAGEGRLAYAPIAAWLKSEALRGRLRALDAPSLSDIARLHPALLADRPDVPAPDRHLESWQRLRFFDALALAFRSASPVVLVLDDLQWADGDTIEWLQFFLRSSAGASCLIVGTVRAGEAADNPPLERLLGYLQRENLVTSLAIGPLDRTATALLAGEVAERPLDEATLARTFRETEGHPLFIVERGRMEPGAPAAAVAAQVQAVVAARLAALSADARAAAEVAAVVGRDFQFDVLAHASDLEEDALVRAVDELWRRHIVRVQADERWDFSHDRIREVAYAGIGPAQRRLIHRRVGQAMEQLCADRLDDASASIAMHLERGGQAARAIPFLERAAAAAMRLSATEEAIRCLDNALTILGTLPAGRDRDERELTLRSNLSVALNSGRGYAAPEIEQNVDRVFVLLRAIRSGHVSVPWLWVAFTVRYMLGDLKGTRDVAEQALAGSRMDPSCRCEAHHAMGGLLLSVGELEASRQHFDAALDAYDEKHPQRSALGSDLGVFTHAWSAHTLCLLGDVDGAVTRAEQAIALAERRDHRYSEALALAYAALLHQMCGDPERVVACAERVVALCERHGFAYYGDWARILMGWVRGHEHPAAGVAMIEAALARLDQSRARARRAYYLSLLADTYAALGRPRQAASTIDSAIAVAEAGGEVWWLPALYLQASIAAPAADGPSLRQRALTLARAQQNRLLERRILDSDGTVARTLSERPVS
jgi:DNA-binding SARP family transcriptional activator